MTTPQQPDWEFLYALPEAPQQCRHCPADIYCDGAPGEWLDEGGSPWCDLETMRKHEPVAPGPLEKEMRR